MKKSVKVKRSAHPDVRPPFADWYCNLHGISATSPIRQRLNMYATLRSLGVDAPGFLMLSESDVTTGRRDERSFFRKPPACRAAGLNGTGQGNAHIYFLWVWGAGALILLCTWLIKQF